jgi:hypothetical protein
VFNHSGTYADLALRADPVSGLAARSALVDGDAGPADPDRRRAATANPLARFLVPVAPLLVCGGVVGQCDLAPGLRHLSQKTTKEPDGRVKGPDGSH